MQIQLLATNIELHQETKDYVDKKLGELDKFLPEGTYVRADVEVEKTTNHHRKGEIFRAEANVFVPGKLLRADAQQENLFAAIDKLKDEVRRELVAYKDKQTDKRRKGAREAKDDLNISDIAK